MPIYGYYNEQWEWVRNIPNYQRMYLRYTLNEAKFKFKKNRDRVFCSSINYNISSDPSYIASFDYTKTGLPESVYQRDMEELLFFANRMLSKETSKAYQGLKFDIKGSWTMGQIIVMKKK